MKKYLFMRAVLTFVGEGRLFTVVLASVLRILAVLLILGALVAWLQLWKLVFDSHGTAILGGVLFQGFFVIGVYMVVHTLWIRAADIQVAHAPEFTVVPIVSVLLKMLGEIYACISLTVGVGGGIAAPFGSGYLGYQITKTIRSIPGFGLPQSLLQELLPRGGGGFLSVILLPVGGAIAALFSLFLFYTASEMLVAVVDIARNTRVLRGVAERFTPSERNNQGQ